MNRWIDAFRRGMTAGRQATTPMTIVMAAARKVGILGDPPPRKITRELLDFFGLSKSDTKEKLLTFLSHYAFGAAVGGLYGVLRETRLLPRGPVVGAAYGTAVWATSYLGWVPALTSMPRPENDRPLRPWAMLGAHWIYGAMLDLHLEREEREASVGEPSRRNARVSTTCGALAS